MIERKLNVGCGNVKLKDYLNVDVTKNVNPDLVIPFLPNKLPFKNKEFDEVLFANAIQYIPHEEVLSTITELVRIGKHVKISFVAGHKTSGAIWKGKPLNQNGYTIGSLRKLRLPKLKGSKSWYDRDFGFKVSKIWIELHFTKKLPFIYLVQWFINSRPFLQAIYEDSFLSCLFHPKWYWVEIKESEVNKNGK